MVPPLTTHNIYALAVGSLLSLLLLAGSIAASPTLGDHASTIRDAPDQSPFGWKKCPNSNDDRWRCGSIKVPHNYHDASDKRTMQIETVLFQVGEARSNHTIVINPGGPGGSGVGYVWYVAENVSKDYSNNTFDVLGFDPRGVNASEPHVFCYPNFGFLDRWVQTGSYYKEKGDKEMDLQVWDSSYEAFFRACRQKYGDLGNYLTTASVARDIDTIRAALNEEKLYYYGLSYGSSLGLTYAQLFPDRVGRMLLDGIDNPVEDRTTAGFGLTALTDRDRVYKEGFIGECIRAGPKNCALAEPLNGSNGTETVTGLQDRINNIFARLHERPAPATDPEFGPGVYWWRDFNDVFASALYNPLRWPKVATGISQFEREGNITFLYARKTYGTFYSDPTECPDPPEKAWGNVELFVICGDSFDADHPGLDFYMNLWKEMTDKAFIGGDAEFLNALPCRHYDWKPVEVYRGGLNANLSYPALLIATSVDPATALDSALSAYKGMGPSNARLVIHHAYGHTSTRMISNCTEQIKRSYLLTEDLPEVGKLTDCYADVPPYPAPEVQAQLAASQAWFPDAWHRPPLGA